MLKPLFFVLLFMTTSGTFAVQAQATGPDIADSASRGKSTRLLHENYLTSSGETVSPTPAPLKAPPPRTSTV